MPGTRDIVCQALHEDKQYTWPQNEHQQRMAIQLIPQPAKIGTTSIFVDRHHPYIAVPPVTEVSATGVVPRMASPPQVVRCECKEAAQAAQEVVRLPATKERVMSAVVLDDEDSDQEASRRDRQQKRQPIRPRKTQIHQIPKTAKRQQRIDDLPATLKLVGSLVLGYGVSPGVALVSGGLLLEFSGVTAHAFTPLLA